MRFSYNLAAAILIVTAACRESSAEAVRGQYPAGTVRMVVPSPAGTPPDMSRALSQTKLPENEGWRLVV